MAVRGPLRRLTALLALAVLGAGCDDPQTVQIPLGTEQLSAIYWEPSKRLSPGVVLLPMLGGSKEDWQQAAARLHKEGFGVLALDLREQGRTDRERLVADVRAGFAFMREQKKVDAARIGLIGASIGANAALNFAAAEPLVRTAVLVSPGLDYRGVLTEPALRDYGVRPLLLLAAEEDLASAGAVRRLADETQSDAVVKIYPGNAHGTDLIEAYEPALDDIVAFLHANL